MRLQFLFNNNNNNKSQCHAGAVVGHYLLNHIVLMCSRNDEETALCGTESAATANDGEQTADEVTSDIVG